MRAITHREIGRNIRYAPDAVSGIGRKQIIGVDIMQTLGIILARAGSLGLVNKHLLPLLGKPVISYTFDHARASRRLDRVVVTSDCPQILELARQSGFDTIVRPEHLATSDASVQSAMLHAMRTVEADESFQSDAVVVPLRQCARSWRWRDRSCHRCSWKRPAAIPCAASVRSASGIPAGCAGSMVIMSARYAPAASIAGRILSRCSCMTARLLPCRERRCSWPTTIRMTRTPFSASIVEPFETGMGDTVEIDHQRDLYWAEAVLRSQAPVLRMVV